MWRSRKNEEAFTLLEMLVALGLMALIATALYAALRTGFRARRSAEAAIEPVRKAGLALEIVRRDLEAAMAPTGILAGAFLGEDAEDAGKDADALAWFTASGKPIEGTSDIVRAELALATQTGETERVLVRRTIRNLLSPTEVELSEQVLCRGISSLNIRYFDGSAWLDEWDSTTQGDVLPFAVETTVEFKKNALVPDDAEPYRLTRVFALPCARSASEEGGRAVRGGSW